MQSIVYVAGPYRGANAWEVEKNVRAAEELSLEVWQAGGVAICPHSNTRFFDGTLPNEVWLKGDLEIVRRCDAVLMTPDWKRSTGASEERALALRCQIPVFYTIAELKVWLAE